MKVSVYRPIRVIAEHEHWPPGAAKSKGSKENEVNSAQRKMKEKQPSGKPARKWLSVSASVDAHMRS